MSVGFAQANDKLLPLKQKLSQANTLLHSFKNDQALTIINDLIDTLSASNQLNTAFGIRVQSRQAEALEKDQKDDIALQNLFYVKQLSEEHEVWDAYANTSLILARLYEKIGLEESCYEHLMDTRKAIQSHEELDSIYPRFSIRYSSYNRIYKDPDTALYYAQEVLRTAPFYEQKEEEAVGHMLMGMLTRDTSREAKLNHYKTAAHLFYQLEDHMGYCYMIGSVAGWHFEHGDPYKALIYNDSTLAAAHRAFRGGVEDRRTLWNAYRFRSTIYKSIGQNDSAWHYLNKSHYTQIKYINEENNEKVLEIDARYNDEKQKQTIAEQEQQIQFETQRRNLLLAILGLIILFTIILSYYSIRLRKEKKKTEEQALLIQEKNKGLSKSLENQIVLQSEVHHRVKNNLQIIISLLDLQKEEIEDPAIQEKLDAMIGRIHSMAAIHEILYQQEDSATINLFDYIENLCTHHSHFSLDKNKPDFDLQIEDLAFNLATSMPVGIMITELITNSLKYARIKGQKLWIHISIKKLKDTYQIIFRDNGPGFKNSTLTEREGGLGCYLLTSMCRQLSGHFESRNQEGARYQIYFKEKTNSETYYISKPIETTPISI